VWAGFSAPVQTGPGAHSACYAVGTGSFPGVKRLGRGVDHQRHVALTLKKESSYMSTPPVGLRGLFYAELYPFNAGIKSLRATLPDEIFYW
jgi:hypothetical protein